MEKKNQALILWIKEILTDAEIKLKSSAVTQPGKGKAVNHSGVSRPKPTTVY